MGVPGSESSIIAGAAGQSGGAAANFYDYQISQSLRIDSTSDYLDSPTWSAGAAEKYTISAWVKRADTGRYQNILGDSAGNWGLVFHTDDTVRLSSHSTVTTTGLFRDTTGWYHIVAGNGTSSSTGFIYVNGVLQTLTTNTWTSNSGAFRSGGKLQVGLSNSGLYNLNGYVAELYAFSNQTKSHTDFGEFKNGVWVPKAYTGSYGDSQDFYLKFASGAIGTDSSGNGNNFSTVGTLGADHIVNDTPTSGDGG